MTEEIALPLARAVALDDLTPHPRNYRSHPPDQLAHLAESLRANGQYRNIVTARDGTILAGHGVALAARQLGWTTVSAIALDLDAHEPRALKILAGDNEVAHLGEIDDRALSEILKQIRDEDASGLLGTGYDDAMLANLVMITRPAAEIADFDAAAEWVGMPEYGDGARGSEIVLHLRFETREDHARCLELLGLPAYNPARGPRQVATSTWWPPRARADVGALAFVEEDDDDDPSSSDAAG